MVPEPGNGEEPPGCLGEFLAVAAIVGLCTSAAVLYGIVHDQVTIRICLEYFTVFHPKVVDTEDPTRLALVWGVLATWWAGVLIGLALAVAARAGSGPKRSARDLARPVMTLMGCMAGVAILSGILGRILASAGVVTVLGPLAGEIPPGEHVNFLTDLWIHNGSYLAGFVGGIVLAVRTWTRRRGSGDPDRVGRGQANLAMVLGILVMAAGYLQSGLDEEFFPRYHFPLLLVLYGLPPVVLGLCAAAASRGPPRRTPLLRNAAAASAVFLGAALFVQGLAEGVVADRTFDMTWATREDRYGSEVRNAVRLTFADRPGWSTVVYSGELADRLTALETPRVPVVIRTVRDFGILRRFKVVKVGEFEEWSYNGHSGWTGNVGWRFRLDGSPEAAGPPPIR